MPSRYKRRKKQPQIDETAMSYTDLISVLPEGTVDEVSKNLVKDQMESSPPFFMQAGEGLYTRGSVGIYGADDKYFDVQIEVPVEIGKKIINQEIEWDIDESIEEQIEMLGLNKDEIVEKIGLFILSNVNRMPLLHNNACQLFDLIGYDAWNDGVGEIGGDGGLADYMIENLDKEIASAGDVKIKFRLQGVKKHIESLLKSFTIQSYKSAMDIYNSALEDIRQNFHDVSWDRNFETRIETEAIKTVFDYLVNPASYLRDNPEIRINLIEYEQQYGKLPRQPQLPGMIYETTKETGYVEGV